MQTCLNGNQKESKFIQKLLNGESEDKMPQEWTKQSSQMWAKPNLVLIKVEKDIEVLQKQTTKKVPWGQFLQN